MASHNVKSFKVCIFLHNKFWSHLNLSHGQPWVPSQVLKTTAIVIIHAFMTDHSSSLWYKAIH